jgi:hypothetical protein
MAFRRFLAQSKLMVLPNAENPKDLILWGNQSASLELVQIVRGQCSSPSLQAVNRCIKLACNPVMAR